VETVQCLESDYMSVTGTLQEFLNLLREKKETQKESILFFSQKIQKYIARISEFFEKINIG